MTFDATGMDELHQAASAVEPPIGARHMHRLDVDIGRQHALPQRTGGGDGEHARTGAEIEDAQFFPRHPEGLRALRGASKGDGPGPGAGILRGSLRSHLRMTVNRCASVL